MKRPKRTNATKKRRHKPAAIKRMAASRHRSGPRFETNKELRRQLDEAREQQTATAEVLKIISASRGELEPVFEAMADARMRSLRICCSTRAKAQVSIG